MRLNVIEKRKAENYTGDSITYELPEISIDKKKYIINKIFELLYMDPVKVKIEYMENENVQTDCVYGKVLSKTQLDKYDNIVYAKIKANIEGTRVSFTIDFKDQYLRIKADYTHNLNGDSVEKIVAQITCDL